MPKAKNLNSPRKAGDEAAPHTPKAVGARIRIARAKVGMTQADLARLCAVTPASVGQWESGATSPALDRIAFLAEVMGVDAVWLAFGKGGRQSKTASPEGAASRSTLQGTRVPLLFILDPWPQATRGKSGILSLLNARRSERSALPSVMTHFPVHPGALALVVSNNENAPDFSIGDIVVVDPDQPPQPGNFVLIEAKTIQQSTALAMLRQYRRGPDGPELAARNADWGVLSMSEATFKASFKGTVTEVTKRLAGHSTA